MSQVEPAPQRGEPQQPSVLAAVLSYVVPGLGQIYQGRVGKGLLFMVCLLGMFFAGQNLGEWKNVYLPSMARGPDSFQNNPWRLPNGLLWVANIIHHRWHFAGQFWIGTAAWPAIWQYENYKDYLYEVDEDTLRKSGLPEPMQTKLQSLMDHPPFDEQPKRRRYESAERLVAAMKLANLTDAEIAQYGPELLKHAYRGTVFGTYQRAPSENELNDYLANRDKMPDVAWVYTVIAGMLNILVIYDALAGPAYGYAFGASARPSLPPRPEGGY